MADKLSEKRKSVEQIVFCSVGLAVFAFAWSVSRDYPDIVRWFPTGVLLATMALLSVKIVLESFRLWRVHRSEDAAVDQEPS